MDENFILEKINEFVFGRMSLLELEDLYSAYIREIYDEGSEELQDIISVIEHGIILKEKGEINEENLRKQVLKKFCKLELPHFKHIEIKN